MASYRREADVLAIERRGRVVWSRTGRAGNRGRIRHREFPSEDAAEAAQRDEIAALLASGWQLVDAAAGVDGATLGGRRSTPADNRPPTATVTHLALVLEGRVLELRTVGDALSTWLDVAAQRCDERLARLAFVLADGALSIEITFASNGQGYNIDAYDMDTLELAAVVDATDDLDDEIVIDRFDGDELWRHSAAALVAIFRAEVARSPKWPAIRALALRDSRLVRHD